MADPFVVAFRRVARGLFLGLSIVLFTTASVGLCYWVRAGVAGWPGPRVADALPLDELPYHASLPLIVFAVMYALGGLCLGVTARALGLDRFAAALVLATGVGLCIYVSDVASLYTVRQIRLGAALRAAETLQPVYLGAVLAGLAAALVGRAPRPGDAWRTLLTWAVALGGVFDVLSGIVPHVASRIGLDESFTTQVVPPVLHALVVPAGVLLLLSSRGLARQNRRAWWVALVLLGASSILHLIRGFDYGEAIFTSLVAIALIARHGDFTRPGDPGSHPRALSRLAGMVAVAFGYGVIALWVNRTISDLPFRFTPAVETTARALVGMAPPSSQYLPASFPEWFPWSVISLVAIGICWALALWVAPWRHLFNEDARRRARAAVVVRWWGTDTLAPFSLRGDKALFFYDSNAKQPALPLAVGTSLGAADVLIAYRVVRGVALISGDPIGPADAIANAVTAFIDQARSHGWRIAILGASERYLDVYKAQGMRVLYHGDEAVIDIETFTLAGGAMKTVRQAANRLERKGFTSEIYFVGEIAAPLRAELLEIETAWLDGRPRTGFVMQFDELFRATREDAVFVVGRGPEGDVAGFLHLAVCHASSSLSLSSMPRRGDTPNGLNAWLVVEAVKWARSHNISHLSLNFSPFAGLLKDEVDIPLTRRIEQGALLGVKHLLSLQLDNLQTFNKKFSPIWQGRYVVYERRSDLPRIVLAAMAAEGYLPFGDAVRGSRWSDDRLAPSAVDLHSEVSQILGPPRLHDE